MTDKEKIRAEIERVKKKQLARNDIGVVTGVEYIVDATKILSFIDSLPEENGRTLFEEIVYPGSFEEFIAGLNPPPKIPEMKKDEELKEAVDAEIVKDIHNLLHVKSGPLPMPSKVKFGDKVRIIILPNE